MSYQVLARKWRPKTFKDVVGQQHVLTALSNALTLGRLHHAYLFSGTRGVGKTSIARLLAKGLNCEQGITATPCGKCQNCQEIEQGCFVDLIEIDAASRTKVEDTREILDNVQYLPTRGRFKVYIIDEVHMLSRSSFNALLKTLEEPPEHIKFLLATTDPQKLPITILSRCLQFHLNALDHEQITQQLEKILTAEQITFQAKALSLLARAAQGSVRDALSLTDQAIALGNGSIMASEVASMLGMLEEDYPLKLMEALVISDANLIMHYIQLLAQRGVDWSNLLNEVVNVLHIVGMLQLLEHYPLDDKEHEPRLRQLARVMTPQDVQLYYQIVLLGRKDLALLPNGRMGVEMTFLRLLAFHPVPPPRVEHSIESAITVSPQAPSALPVVSAADMAKPQQRQIQPVEAQREKARSPASSAAVKPVPMSAQQDSEPAVERVIPNANPVSQPRTTVMGNQPPLQSQQAITPPSSRQQQASEVMSESTLALLSARNLLRQKQEKADTSSVKRQAPSATPKKSGSVFARLSAVVEDKAAKSEIIADEDQQGKQEAYRWQAKHGYEKPETETLATPKAIRQALQVEKTPELVAKLVKEVVQRDAWSAVVQAIKTTQLAKHLLLSAFKEERADGGICLHLRTAQKHLNTEDIRENIAQALSEYYQRPVALTVVEDDSTEGKTPLEWRQLVYEEKLIQAKQAINDDKNIQLFCQFFDAQLDEQSIQPV